jgi:polyvinyl alcohol dehydrogenase (cytochrome)
MLVTRQRSLPRCSAVFYLAVFLSATAILIVPALQAEGPGERSKWRMAGHDIRDTRNQPFEWRIGPRNAPKLATKWVLTTAGDVSATPAVVEDDDRGRDLRRFRGRDDESGKVVYFTDWGGKLWKVDAGTGEVVWSRSVPDYNGIPGSLSRTSPVVAGGMVYIGDLNGNMMAVDSATGDLRWITRVDPHPAAIITASPIILNRTLYVDVSSNESAYARATPGYQCCTFRGSMLAIDARTGRILWQSFVLPDNNGQAGAFAGGAFVNPPAIDIENELVYAAAGQLYTQPEAVTNCLAAAGGWNEACFPRDARFNSIVAFDLRTGRPRWSFRGAGADARELVCGKLPASVTWCPPADLFHVWDFAGAGPNVFRTRIDGRLRSVVGIGQKSGVYWLLDARTGEYLWSRLVGPGSDPGGIQWGTAYDGNRIYAAIGHNTGEAYTLPSGEVVTGGSWAALDPSTGRILWQTPDPQSAPDIAALTVANGVVYAGSLARTGDQMYALDAGTGKILWRFASGGSVVDGPAVVDGTVYWGSGYARTGGVGNNKFYAFSVGGK